MKKIFIDGSYGTTGLRIHERLQERSDIECISIPFEQRHDDALRREAMNNADIVFLCLPDAAAKEAVNMIENDQTVVIDTSTAHRTIWTYGLPELEGQRDKIRNAKRIANPGCHASGFIALVQPLVKSGLIQKDARLTCFSLTGYSGGGKKMIAEYESSERSILLDAPRQYGLTQEHKHLKEMVYISGLEKAPAFCPIVADYYSGMQTVVTLFKENLNGTMEDIKSLYQQIYNNGMIHYCDHDEAMLAGNAWSGRDDMEITVRGNEDRILLISGFDNLGKGASGAAIQNMNIILGCDETTGLAGGNYGMD